MEMLNRIELRGVVGSARTMKVSESEVTRFSVATDYFFKNKDGEAVVETTWHSVMAWDKGLSELKRGDKVEVVGRIRNTRYTDSEGLERTSTEVVASEVKVL